MGRARTLLAACALLAATRTADAAAIAKAWAPKFVATRTQAGVSGGLQGLLEGPAILPNVAGVQLEGTTGVLRTLELDDTTSLHVRLAIPF